MKVLVTGGAGFIGSSLTSKLLSLKKNVVVIDNFEPFYNPEEKKRNIAPFSSDKNFKLITGDIRKREEMLEIFRKEKFETVVHLAAKAGVRPSIKDPVGYAETNIKGTLNVLDAARDTGVKNFIFGSSSSVYGERSEVPFSESDMADNPISPYGLTKLSSEKTCRVYNNLFGLKTTVLRFFTVYGPGQRPDLAIRKFIQLISEGQEIEMYGDGSSMRDYTYVDDIVEGILSALSSPRDFEVINLGNSKPVLLKDLINIIEDELGKKAKIKKMSSQDGDVSRTYANISKAKSMLNWSPRTDIREGIEKMVDWYNGKN